MILGRFPASDDAGPVAPPGVFARVAGLEAEVERLRRIETAAREFFRVESETASQLLKGPATWGATWRAKDALRAALEASAGPDPTEARGGRNV